MTAQLVLAWLSDNDLQALGQCVQAAAALLALPYIAVQLYETKKQAGEQARMHSDQLEHQIKAIESSTTAAKASVYQGFTDLMVRIDMCFVDHPDLRPYFYGKQDVPPEGSEAQRVFAIAEALRDLEDHVARHEHFLEPAVFAGWKEYFTFLRAHSPAYARFCDFTTEWYVDGGAGRRTPDAGRRDESPST